QRSRRIVDGVDARRARQSRRTACYRDRVSVEAAARRRRTWQGGVAAESVSLDRAVWQSATVDQRLDALRTMAEQAGMMEGHGGPPRLQRHLSGVRKARG